jgi:hypothetical protein
MREYYPKERASREAASGLPGAAPEAAQGCLVIEPTKKKKALEGLLLVIQWTGL